MATRKDLHVRDLSLDLNNYRTMPQPSEEAALTAMIQTRPDNFWALTVSLLEDGYLPTESVIVLVRGDQNVVREGNRRVAALKMILGQLTPIDITIPAAVDRAIAGVSGSWKKANKQIPCVVYPASSAAVVDRIVTLTHGKGEKAGRDQWNAMARARHNRDAREQSEPALDLLEKYLATGRNVTKAQAARWSGDYPLTVLAEVMKRLAPRLGVKSAPDLPSTYPNLAYRDSLEEIIRDIGQGMVGFDRIRTEGDQFGVSYGIPTKSSGAGGGGAGGSGGASRPSEATGETGATGGSKPKPKATRIDDSRTVRKILRNFAPRGAGREKIVDLRDEMLKLKLADTPLAFCFLLRSAFEISAKTYCADHAAANGPTVNDKKGRERPLVDVLRDVTSHLTKNNTDTVQVKQLHGSLTGTRKQRRPAVSDVDEPACSQS